MSEVEETTQPARSKAPRNRGPRRSGGRGSGGRARATEDAKGSDEEPAQARETIMSPSVPKSMIGTTVTGKICDIVKRGRGQFGFILIGEGTRSETPRIYFSFKDYTEVNYPPRRSYLVEFECSEDDSERAFASNVRLTPEGLKDASERDAKHQANPEAKRDPVAERRVRRPRKDVGEGRTVVLKVTCEGMTETKQVTANVTQSIGKLKHSATVEFGAPIEYNVFRITPEHPEGVLLSKAMFSDMNDHDLIHIRKSTEVAAITLPEA